jgi:hypothetical protein
VDPQPLSDFSPATRASFERTFEAPTPPQERGWQPITPRRPIRRRPE